MTAASIRSGQQARTFEGQISKTVHLDYLLFLPNDYGNDPHVKWPLILFLHGMGERGNDLELVKKHGIPRVVEQQPDFPFITISPQCPMDSFWTNELDALKALLDDVAARYAVDTGRIYLTGLSMGGYGSWHLATECPERFAAVAPICGGGMFWAGFPERVRALKNVPIWAFHGAKDTVVPLEESEKMVKALKAVGGDVRLTVYPDADHDSWTRTYNNPELYRWFLRNRRNRG